MTCGLLVMTYRKSGPPDLEVFTVQGSERTMDVVPYVQMLLHARKQNGHEPPDVERFILLLEQTRTITILRHDKEVIYSGAKPFTPNYGGEELAFRSLPRSDVIDVRNPFKIANVGAQEQVRIHASWSNDRQEENALFLVRLNIFDASLPFETACRKVETWLRNHLLKTHPSFRNKNEHLRLTVSRRSGLDWVSSPGPGERDDFTLNIRGSTVLLELAPLLEESGLLAFEPGDFVQLGKIS